MYPARAIHLQPSECTSMAHCLTVASLDPSKTLKAILFEDLSLGADVVAIVVVAAAAAAVVVSVDAVMGVLDQTMPEKGCIVDEWAEHGGGIAPGNKKDEMKSGSGFHRTYLHGLPEVVLEETTWELMVDMNSTMEDLNGAQPGRGAD